MNFPRWVASTPAFARSYAAKYRRPKPGTSEKPPYRAGDPLVNNPDAVVTALEDEGLTFIHRPPPTAPSPFSLTTAPVSPLLRPPTTATGPLPPLSRPVTFQPKERASDETVAEIQRLRASDPTKYTRGRLAKMFNTSQGFVGAVAALKHPLRKSAIRVRDQTHEKHKEKWSERHQIVKAIRSKRRELW